jgi:predicted Fe-S protein YdhL (DUF1289 family)
MISKTDSTPGWVRTLVSGFCHGCGRTAVAI